jgi:TatD DNase family protein
MNVTKIVCAGYNVDASKEAVRIAQDYDWIYATCGISPNDTEDFSDEKIEEIKKLAIENKVVAIGEIGLDYYWNKNNKDLQKKIFEKQLEIANLLKLPIVIHKRDAWQETLEILRKIPVEKKGIFHCCPLNQELIKEAVKLGFYISFSGNVTFKNAKSEPCIKLVPIDKILIETDAPYLTPEPHRGKVNEPKYTHYVAQKIAELKNISVEEVYNTTTNNAYTLFKKLRKD